MSSVREQILDNIKSTLEGISGIGLVTREPVGWDEVAQGQYPALVIMPTRMSMTQFGQTEAWDFRVTIWGYARNDHDVAQALEELLNDTWIALKADPERGDLAGTTEAINVDSGFWDRNLGIFALEVKVIYYTTNTAF
jgi:hypothetical protein